MTTSNYTAEIVDDADLNTPPPAFNDGVREGSALDILKEAVAEQVRLDPIVHRVPGRPNLAVIMDPNIDGELFQRWQRSAIIGKQKQGTTPNVDAIRFCAIVVANTTIGVKVYNGAEWVEVSDDTGQSLTFANAFFRNLLAKGKPINSATQLVRELFAIDGHLIDAANACVEAAGYGDQVNFDEENPTMV